MALGDIFKKYLGRDINAEERGFFERLLGEGNVSEYEIGQIIQATPEAEERRLLAQERQYGERLAAGDTAMLERAGDVLSSRFAQAGRQSTGSAYQQAYFAAARDLGMARQQQMAQFYGGGLGEIRGAYSRAGELAMGRGYGLRDEARQRSYQIEDYYRQMKDYGDMMKTQNRWNLQSSIAQAGIGLGAGLIGSWLGSAPSLASSQASPNMGMSGNLSLIQSPYSRKYF